MKPEKILVSACLVGVRCRFDANTKEDARLLALAQNNQLVPVCPEQLAGLSTPRDRNEIIAGRVISERGKDNTDLFQMGAHEALKIARLTRCSRAVLKARSPSCGKGEVYDGTFQGGLVKGNGVLAELLLSNGIPVSTEDEL
jgi:uncharacterized protein YbbK (DUF523 family)